MSKLSAQPQDGDKVSDSTEDVRFHFIEDAESFHGYQPGGYHPVAIGDHLGGRYHVLNKLGHGSYSTVWLARDKTLQRLVAVKVCAGYASKHESKVLSLLGNSPAVNNEGDGGDLGRAIMPTLLDTFCIDGPNGTHICLVTEVADKCLALAKGAGGFNTFILPAARAIAAQFILAVAFMHGKGFVHGDLHYGNVLLKLPREVQSWTDEELLERCGEPQLEAVTTFDDKPIPPGVPPVAVLPIWFPTERVTKLPLSKARIVIADFGEAYCPSEETRFECHTVTHSRPPESWFEPTTPKSFPSDIWTAACTLWSIIATSPLFNLLIPTEDAVTWMQVQVLGKLPDEWWEKWDARSQDFTEDGQVIPRDGFPIYSLDYLFERDVQEGRRTNKTGTMDSAERDALFAMLLPMLAYRPDQRCSIKEVLNSEWMTKYAMPDYKRMQDESRTTETGM